MYSRSLIFNLLGLFVSGYFTYFIYREQFGVQYVELDEDDLSSFSHYLMYRNNKYGLIDEMPKNYFNHWRISSLIMPVIIAVLSILTFRSYLKQRNLATSLESIRTETVLKDKQLTDLQQRCFQLMQEGYETNTRFNEKEHEMNQEISGLRDKCALLEEDNLELKNIKTQMETELQKEKQHRNCIESHLNTMCIDFAQKTLDMHNLETAIQKLKDENELLRNDPDDEKKENSCPNEEIAEKVAQENEMMEVISKQNEECNQLQHKVCNLESTNDEISRAIENMRRDIQRVIQRKNSEIEGVLNAQTKEIEELTAANQNMEKVVNDTENELEEKIKALDNTKCQLVTAEQEITMLQDKLGVKRTAINELQEAAMKEKDAVENLQRQLSAANRDGKVLACDNKELKYHLNQHIQIKNEVLQKMLELDEELHYSK